MQKLLIKVGDKFNLLTVVSETRNKHNQKQLICQCDCGNTVKCMPSNLFNSKTKSCGCLKINRLKNNTIYSVGHKIGKLTIKKEIASNKGKRVVEVECDCGKIKTINLSYNSFSCGCEKRKSKDPFQTEYNRFIRVSKRRNIQCALNKTEYTNLILGSCFYCNKKPELKMKVGNQLKNSIDRLDNTVGYNNANSVTCCADCNFAKRQLSLDSFLTMIKKIYENHNLDLKYLV
jgi:hypothetical protein